MATPVTHWMTWRVRRQAKKEAKMDDKTREVPMKVRLQALQTAIKMAAMGDSRALVTILLEQEKVLMEQAKAT